MNTSVLGAVFRRNFVSYFANPTGYVFICVFVLLSTVAAFFPNEFFNANLANLNQLNLVFPFIMLVFIPAITMAAWADERRQGTDELLLTIPAADMEIVLGKYLAALAIYSVSLLFSLVSNYTVLALLGEPDLGLFLGNYVGYWFVGVAMLAVGMVASFLTGNLTVSYILGAVFNAPLVFAIAADNVLSGDWAYAIKRWSIGQQLADFGRGVITLSGITYLVMVAVVMLYICMVLIGRRHWSGGRDGRSMFGHFVVRTLALVAVAVGLSLLFQWHDRRLDVTSERLSSLSPDTEKLIANLKLERPVQIEAFVSPTVPESYVQARLNLLGMLRELQARGGEKVRVRINNTERFTEDAARAEQTYGITPRQVASLNRGALTTNHIFMGVAFRSGLAKVILPFIDRGIPLEYELVRSLATVTQQTRKRVGILQTDAQLYGQFNMQSMSSSSNWPIIDELEKQYEVVQVDPANAIGEKYDVLLAVQPSSLGPEAMENFLAAVRNGQPTAIFEDPFPVFASDVPGTSAPRQPPGGGNPMMMMMGGGRQNQPKGDIASLWRLLGVDYSPEQVIWQRYNPYRKATQFPEEFVFVDEGAAKEPFNEADKISSKLQHMLFPFPGAVNKLQASELTFTPLVKTGDLTGTVQFSEITNSSPFGARGLNEQRRQIPTNANYVLAAEIKGKIKPLANMADEGKPQPKAAAPKPEAAAKAEAKPAAKAEAKAEARPETPKPEAAAKAEAKPETLKPEAAAKAEAKPAAKPDADAGHDHAGHDHAGHDHAGHDHGAAKVEVAKPAADANAAKPEQPKETEVHVVVVADVDILTRDFFRLREQGEIPEAEIRFDFDNVTFVLNILDKLAGDDRFMEIRKRRPKHRTLTAIEARTEEAKQQAAESREKLIREFEEAQGKEQKRLNEKIEELKKRKDIDPQQMLIEVALAQEDGNRRLEATVDRLKQERDSKTNKIETDLALQVRRVQDNYKFWALALPPIPPLLIGLIVWANRRASEREGVARARLR